jgi:hypothetical protein
VISFTPWPPYSHGKSSRYPLDRRRGRPQSRPGNDGEEKNSQPLPGLKPYIIQPVAQFKPIRHKALTMRHKLTRSLYLLHRGSLSINHKQEDSQICLCGMLMAEMNGVGVELEGGWIVT